MESTLPDTQLENKPSKYPMKDYAKKEYWDERFTKDEGNFDWYVSYKQIRPHFERIFNPLDGPYDILMVGSGNSRLSIDMHEHGYANITNVDYCDIVLHKMRTQTCEAGLDQEFASMDATRMPFRDSCFDIVLDKGTFDALACENNRLPMQTLTQEMLRVTRKGGATVIITNGTEEKRVHYFE